MQIHNRYFGFRLQFTQWLSFCLLLFPSTFSITCQYLLQNSFFVSASTSWYFVHALKFFIGTLTSCLSSQYFRFHQFHCCAVKFTYRTSGVKRQLGLRRKWTWYPHPLKADGLIPRSVGKYEIHFQGYLDQPHHRAELHILSRPTVPRIGYTSSKTLLREDAGDIDIKDKYSPSIAINKSHESSVHTK